MFTLKLNIVVLAAGKGTRMHSDKPKVLHQLAGTSLLGHVISCAEKLSPEKIIVVYGFGGEAVPQAFPDKAITWVKQAEQLGTGHAVLQAAPYLDDDAACLILLGDVPLIRPATCENLIAKGQQGLALLTLNKPDPTGYGRIVRKTDEQVSAIVEHKDASDAERAIQEVNSGMMAMPGHWLKKWLGALSNHNSQGEYYLTDIVAMAVQDKVPVTAEVSQNEWEATGVNSKLDLAAVERVYQQDVANQLLLAGVTLADPNRIEVRGDLQVGRDVEIDVGCIFEGKVVLGDGVKVSAYCVIREASIGAGTLIAPYSHMDNVKVANDCIIGPYARLRPGTELAQDVHIGNFVEIKNSQVNVSSKINHLTYVGDSTVGKDVNIGAGTITCNYDGANKHRTVIGDNVFIGSASQLVAPVTIGDGATVGAGSTITRDVPMGELAVSRGRQTIIRGWRRPVKKRGE